MNQVIEPEDLSMSAAVAAGLSLKDARDTFEREYIVNVLREVKFNISEAAKIAGISRPTFYDLLKKHSIVLEKRISYKVDPSRSRRPLPP